MGLVPLEIRDDLWDQIHPIILQEDPPKATGSKRTQPRRNLDGIIFRMNTGWQWNAMLTPPTRGNIIGSNMDLYAHAL